MYVESLLKAIGLMRLFIKDETVTYLFMATYVIS